MNKIERKSAVVVITGLLVLGVLTLATGIGSATAEAPAVPLVTVDLFSAPEWDDFDHHYLPAQVTNLAGNYSVTSEGFLISLVPGVPVLPWQDKGRLGTVEQFGSLLGVAIDVGVVTSNFLGSTTGDNVVLKQSGFAGRALGTVLDGGDKIILHSNVQVVDNDNNPRSVFVGTLVLDRVKE